MAFDDEGRLLVSGFDVSKGHPVIAVDRYADGKLDQTFTHTEIAVQDSDDFADLVVDVSPDSGRIYLLSADRIQALLADGGLERSFADGGALQLKGQVRAIQATDDGVDVALQYTGDGVVERYNKQGALVRALPVHPPRTADIAIDRMSSAGDTVTVLATTTDIGGRTHQVLTRFDDGGLDKSFGIGGYLFDVGMVSGNAPGLIDNGGSLYMSGDWSGSEAASRFTAEGLPDSQWGPAALPAVDERFGIYADGALSYRSDGMSALAGDRLLIAAQAMLGGDNTVGLFVAAYDEDGKLDRSYGVDGVAGILDARGVEGAQTLALASSTDHAAALIRAGNELRVVLIA